MLLYRPSFTHDQASVFHDSSSKILCEQSDSHGYGRTNQIDAEDNHPAHGRHTEYLSWSFNRPDTVHAPARSTNDKATASEAFPDFASYFSDVSFHLLHDIT
jgi:hypothetical protein